MEPVLAKSDFDEYDRIKELKEFDESKVGVKGLSDSGITSIPRIFVHPPESLSDVLKNPPEYSQGISIPVIDLSGANSPEDRPRIVDQVKEAAKTWGFFQVVNHGIPIQAMNDVVSSVGAFHDMSHEEKSKYYKRQAGGRGVMYASNYDLLRSRVATWHDFLTAFVAPAAPEPEEFPEVCRDAVVAWVPRAGGAAELVAELLGEGLGLESGKLKEMSFLDSRVLTGICYPRCPEPDRTLGIVPHTDSGFLTVLIQNHVPGLQVKHHGAWVDVKPEPGGLIVNIGDFLQIASNGEYKSVEHRVLANSLNESRISVVVFFSIRHCDGYYGPLPELCSPEKPRKYRDFTFQEFSENFYSKGFDSKSLIDKVKI